MIRAIALALALALGVLLSLVSNTASADVFRPAYLELKEAGGGRYDVLWKVPAPSEEMALALDVVFPGGTKVVAPPRMLFTGDALVKSWQVQRSGGLVGQSIRVEGKAARATNVIARLERRDGTSQMEHLSLDRLEFVVTAPSGTLTVAWSYLVLGIEHILAGFDHLLFVLALLLIVRGGRRIVSTITAFTLAHSLTLAAATLGWVDVPTPPVEAVIALSIAFVAAEVVHGRRGQLGLTARAPWTVAFSFGLLHGFGFASALSEVGLPETAIPIALLTFNIGVELGQLGFVCAVVAGAVGYRWLARKFVLAVRLRQRLADLVPYTIGSVAMFWVVERVASFWE